MSFAHPNGLPHPLLGSDPVNRELAAYDCRLWREGFHPCYMQGGCAWADTQRFNEIQRGTLTPAKSHALHIMRANAVTHRVSITC